MGPKNASIGEVFVTKMGRSYVYRGDNVWAISRPVTEQERLPETLDLSAEVARLAASIAADIKSHASSIARLNSDLRLLLGQPIYGAV